MNAMKLHTHVSAAMSAWCSNTQQRGQLLYKYHCRLCYKYILCFKDKRVLKVIF